MALSGVLSNPLLGDLLQCLTDGRPDQERRRSRRRETGWSDGRRQFGTVSGAIKAVLAEGDSEMRMKTIHAEVERVLGSRVSFQSVADCLTKRSKGPRPFFVRTRYGPYRMLR